MTDTFITWRQAKLGRETSVEQRQTLRALNMFLEQRADGHVAMLTGTPGAGQTTVICDWTQWVLRTYDDVSVYIVSFAPGILRTKVARGLLPSESDRLHVTNTIVDTKPGAVVICDGAAPSAAARGRIDRAS